MNCINTDHEITKQIQITAVLKNEEIHNLNLHLVHKY